MALPVRISRGQQADPFEMVRQDFGDMLARFFGPQIAEGGRLAPYGVDVREDADHIYVEAELPGFKKDEVDVQLENGILTISAEKKEEPAEQKKGDYLLRERRYQRFYRSFTLPTSVDEQNVNAKFQDGILTITLNKREEAKPKKIPLS